MKTAKKPAKKIAAKSAKKKTAAKGPGNDQIARMFVAEAVDVLERFLPRIVKCLEELSEEEIWARPNPASNSAGNLALHLSGNMRQWIIHGLGGAPDVRDRDAEFSERGPVLRRELISRLQKTVAVSSRVIGKLSPVALAREYVIQGFQVTGLQAVSNVYQHFSHHAGQIIYITKTIHGEDLRFTRLPGVKRVKPVQLTWP